MTRSPAFQAVHSPSSHPAGRVAAFQNAGLSGFPGQLVVAKKKNGRNGAKHQRTDAHLPPMVDACRSSMLGSCADLNGSDGWAQEWPERGTDQRQLPTVRRGRSGRTDVVRVQNSQQCRSALNGIRIVLLGEVHHQHSPNGLGQGIVVAQSSLLR